VFCEASVRMMRKVHHVKEFKSRNTFFFCFLLSISYDKFLDNLVVIRLSEFATFDGLVVGIATFEGLFGTGVAFFSSLISSCCHNIEWISPTFAPPKCT
jgi:hypothetical protein